MKAMKRTTKSAALPAALLLLGLATACRDAGPDSGTERAGAEAGHREAAPAGKAMGTDDNLVRIAPEMLRDLKMTTARAAARPATEGVSALGELRVDENAYAAVTAPIPARIVALRAEPGQSVRAGQVLAELQSVELGRAQAAYESAAARQKLAGQTLERKRGLAAERIVSLGELQQAESAAAEAQAELRAAQSGLAALGVRTATGNGDPSRFPLASPIGGTILERMALRGETADPAKPLFRIADLSHLWLIVQAFERDAVRIREGAAAKVLFAALPGRAFQGAVARVGSEVASASRTVPVRIDLANPGGLLRPGMSATAWLPLADAGGTVITVPTSALQRLEEGWSVFLPRGVGTFEARAVGRGRDLGGEIEILSGLQAGDTVVVDGAFLLKAEADKAHGGGEHDHD
jgi:cobalt-zinc-cadmium efflux system membrane fusion protein